MNRFLLLVATASVASAPTFQSNHPRTPQQRVIENGMRPVVSPNGQWIAFGSNRDGTSDIYLTDVDGSRVIRLTADSAQEGSIAWSQDSKRVLYSVSTGDTARLYSVQADGAGRREVLRVPGRNPMISPDGRKVIYAVGGWENMQVVIADLDGSHATQISPPGAAYYNHRFSPNGSLVAVSRSAPSEMQVWLLDPEGRNPRPLTRFATGRPQSPAWSPDGRAIALQGAVADPTDSKKHIGNIWIVDVSTGAATKLAEHTEPYLDESPNWSPNGKHVAFQSNRTGRWEVWLMNADGTGSRQITR